MAKGLHREVPGKKSDTPGRAKRHAHLEVASALNMAVHGNDFAKDIRKLEVSQMIDRILEERKAIVGPGGYMDRAAPGRITRSLKLIWARSTKFDFDGSMSEWKLGRRNREMAKLGIVIGDDVVEKAIEEGELAIDGIDESNEGKFILLAK
jgi:hypothetical protein